MQEAIMGAFGMDVHIAESTVKPHLFGGRLRCIFRCLAVCMSGKLLERDDQHMRVFIEEPFAAQRLRDRLESLETACSKFFGNPIRVQIETTEANAEAGSGVATDARTALTGEALRELSQRALKNPAVNRAVEILDGEIVEIRPTGNTR